MENISGIFDKNGLGDTRSKADKQIKAVIIKNLRYHQPAAAQPENIIDWIISCKINAAA